MALRLSRRLAPPAATGQQGQSCEMWGPMRWQELERGNLLLQVP